MTSTQAHKDPVMVAKHALHVAMQKARGKTPLPFHNWLIFFQAGRMGGNMSGSDKSAAGKRSAEVRRANAEKRKLQPFEA